MDVKEDEHAASWAVAAVCGMLIARWSSRIALPMLLLDSLARGLFAVVGVERTLAADYPPASAVLVGVIAAMAGGPSYGQPS